MVKMCVHDEDISEVGITSRRQCRIKSARARFLLVVADPPCQLPGHLSWLRGFVSHRCGRVIFLTPTCHVIPQTHAKLPHQHRELDVSLWSARIPLTPVFPPSYPQHGPAVPRGA